MPLDDGWKEQLAFTSGTVLLWALLLTRLLPIAAAMQLPNGWQIVDPQGLADTDLPVFSFLTLFGALGITDFLIGAAHIGARGLWLASNTSDDTTEGTDFAADILKKIDIFRRRTFESVFWMATLSVIFLGIYPILFAANEIQHGLHRLFSVQSHFVGVALYDVATFISLLILPSLVASSQRTRPSI